MLSRGAAMPFPLLLPLCCRSSPRLRLCAPSSIPHPSARLRSTCQAALSMLALLMLSFICT